MNTFPFQLERTCVTFSQTSSVIKSSHMMSLSLEHFYLAKVTLQVQSFKRCQHVDHHQVKEYPTILYEDQSKEYNLHQVVE